MHRAKTAPVARKAKRTPGDWLKAPVVSRLVHYHAEGDLRVSATTRKYLKDVGQKFLEKCLERVVALTVLSKKSTLMYKHVSAIAKGMEISIPSEKQFEVEAKVVKSKEGGVTKLRAGMTSCIAPGTFSRAVKMAMGGKIKLGSKGRQALRALVEQALVELINDASKFTASAKRSTMYPEDVSAAISLSKRF